MFLGTDNRHLLPNGMDMAIAARAQADTMHGRRCCHRPPPGRAASGTKSTLCVGAEVQRLLIGRGRCGNDWEQPGRGRGRSAGAAAAARPRWLCCPYKEVTRPEVSELNFDRCWSGADNVDMDVYSPGAGGDDAWAPPLPPDPPRPGGAQPGRDPRGAPRAPPPTQPSGGSTGGAAAPSAPMQARLIRSALTQHWTIPPSLLLTRYALG